MAKLKQNLSIPFDFEIDDEPLEEVLTPRAGLPLVAEMFRALGGSASVARNVVVKQRDRGATAAEIVEDFLLLLADGGECLDDFDVLRQDQGLAELLGRTISQADVARKFLYRFHDLELEDKRPKDVLAWVPPETAALVGLHAVNCDVIAGICARLPQMPSALTVDMDASIIESSKAEARRTYEGERGYQPEFAVWAETGIVLADEFRDGNVPAGMDPLAVVKRAFNAVPDSIQSKLKLAFRGDSACYNHDLLNWLRDKRRSNGPQGNIRFAISADMSQALAKAVRAVPESKWRPFRRPDGEAVAAEANEERMWADVDFVPTDGPTKKDTPADRYIAIRIRKRQGELFADGNGERHFAIVTNDVDSDGGAVIWWHRQKAGTIEQLHRVLKDGLGLGVLPCGRFGANAAWTRLNVLANNTLQGLKLIALPKQDQNAHPKRLRFLHFTMAARITRSARKTWLRLATTADRVADWIAVRLKVWAKVAPAVAMTS